MIARRDLLRSSIFTGSLFLTGFDRLSWPHSTPTRDEDPFRGGTLRGTVEFSDEGKAPVGQLLGAELDGRLFTDLSKINPENPVTPTGSFYIRTRASTLLDASNPWSIQLGGLVERPSTLPFHDLQRLAQPMGRHLLECAGNSRGAHFGMLSVADWDGVPLESVLDRIATKPHATRVLISGFDHYASESKSSWPGASWIFTRDQLESARAFLATKMNAQALTLDHGAPVRLVVPGWYGCTCIKWVNEIILVDEDTPATSQMQEYANRTMQLGVPTLARDYQPASLDTAAMPIRIEKWLVNDKLKYRIVGIQWGGSRFIDGLEIRFNREEFLPVEDFHQVSNNSWNFWSQPWYPQKTGRYIIRLRLKGSNNASKRLDSDYYLRSVEITEI
jgi:DMSO/TMAO reductase YedYZ molybdopterin-dependent catalytic subunit